ncbi:peptide chain release factor N(5)-glutamine methyltransferase [Candidatus Parcubacteria bacterium]|nr:peptide chain release factor N(5)-glutamine methyltransferase [Candidatus Parcubacteria bacterium]
MTINQAIIESARKLQKNKIPTPRLDADLLLSFILKKPREWMLARPKFKLTKFQIFKINRLVRRRIKGVPLAYLVKEKEFYGLKFKVNKHVLVPRPETEMMVDVIRQQTADSRQQIIFIDVGTGSGCIIITLAKKIRFGRFIATDMSKKALKIAKENAELHNLHNIKFLQGNLLSPIINNPQSPIPNPQLIITANLPYLTPIQLKNSPTVQTEPKNALLGGSDGLKYYRELFEQLKTLKNKKITVLCEIDAGQSGPIAKLIKEKLPEYKFQIKKDLRGLDRLVKIEKI